MLPRHQTLRALIDWSYDLLTESERVLLRRLSVFVGGCALAAVEAICVGEGIKAWEVLDLLTSLVEKSLVQYEEQNGEERYRLLETIRQYGMERLRQSEEEAVWQERHRDWYLALAERAEGELKGAAQGECLERLEAEHDNLRAALDWSLHRGDLQAGLRLGAAMGAFWNRRGYWTEGRERLAQVLALPGASQHTAARVKLLNGAGILAYYQGDYAAAWALWEEGLAIGRELDDRQGVANSLNNLGTIALYQSDYAAAHSLYQESLAIRRELGDRQGIATSLHNLGEVARYQGDYETARTLYQESLAIWRELEHLAGIANSLFALGNVTFFQKEYGAAHALYEESLAVRRELGDRHGTANSLICLGNVAYYQGDYVAARSRYETSLSIQRELGDKWGIALSLGSLANVALSQEEYAEARALWKESLPLLQELGNRQGIAEGLERLADVVSGQGQPERAVRLLGAAAGIRETIGAPLPPQEQVDQERRLADLHAALDEPTFAAAWAEGRGAPPEGWSALEHAVADALTEAV